MVFGGRSKSLCTIKALFLLCQRLQVYCAETQEIYHGTPRPLYPTSRTKTNCLSLGAHFFQDFQYSFDTILFLLNLVNIFSLKHYRLATDLLGVDMVLPTFKSTFYILKYKEGERVSTYNDTVSLGSAFRDQSFFEACFYHYMDCLLRRLFRSAPTTLWSLGYYRSRGSYGFTIFHFGCLLLICTCFALRPISLAGEYILSTYRFILLPLYNKAYKLRM